MKVSQIEEVFDVPRYSRNYNLYFPFDISVRLSLNLEPYESAIIVTFRIADFRSIYSSNL
ncbi:hypothetical protein GCM10027170_34310 [Aliiglaciecola aliphaticivorans]